MTLRESVINEVLRDPSALASITPRGIRQRAIRLDTVTSLPRSPIEGDEVLYLADDVNSVIWHLRYRPIGSLFKWEWVGGSTLRASNAGTSMTTASTTYVDLSTPGPAITVPLAGDYVVEAWAQAQHGTAAALGTMAIKVGAAATSDTNAVRGQAPANNYDISIAQLSKEISVPTAGTVLTVQFKTNTGTLTVNNAGLINPWMTVRPKRVGA